jgi:hypothetical protein
VVRQFCTEAIPRTCERLLAIHHKYHLLGRLTHLRTSRPALSCILQPRPTASACLPSIMDSQDNLRPLPRRQASQTHEYRTILVSNMHCSS